jgi:hypothetical protein
MSQIFISHSKRDRPLVDLFARAFGSTSVKAVFVEYESLMNGQSVKTQHIQNAIQNSAAVFVLLSANVNDLPHTRDWVNWETGVAAHAGKDIWLFETASDQGKIDVVIPWFSHYIPIDVTIEHAYSYVRNIIESYDDSQVLPNAAALGFLGAIGMTMLAPPQEQQNAAIAGGALGAFFGAASASKKHMRPMGTSTQCSKCKRVYHIHVPYGYSFRCPGCNSQLELIKPGPKLPQ